MDGWMDGWMDMWVRIDHPSDEIYIVLSKPYTVILCNLEVGYEPPLKLRVS